MRSSATHTSSCEPKTGSRRTQTHASTAAGGLKDEDGHCKEIRCPFHGFTWALGGALQHIPAEWDFDHIDRETFSLPECQVGEWAGFVMINPDPDAEPLADFLGEIVEQFEVWDMAKRYKQAHVAKVIAANWKNRPRGIL